MSPSHENKPTWVSTVGASRDHLYLPGHTESLCGYEGRLGNEPKAKRRPKCAHCRRRNPSV